MKNQAYYIVNKLLLFRRQLEHDPVRVVVGRGEPHLGVLGGPVAPCVARLPLAADRARDRLAVEVRRGKNVSVFGKCLGPISSVSRKCLDQNLSVSGSQKTPSNL